MGDLSEPLSCQDSVGFGLGEGGEAPVLEPSILTARLPWSRLPPWTSHFLFSIQMVTRCVGRLNESTHQINHINESLSKSCFPCILYCFFFFFKSRRWYCFLSTNLFAFPVPAHSCFYKQGWCPRSFPRLPQPTGASGQSLWWRFLRGRLR